jgi:hypothetical protein
MMDGVQFAPLRITSLKLDPDRAHDEKLRPFRIGFDPMPRSEQRASGHRELLDDGSERKRG